MTSVHRTASAGAAARSPFCERLAALCPQPGSVASGRAAGVLSANKEWSSEENSSHHGRPGRDAHGRGHGQRSSAVERSTGAPASTRNRVATGAHLEVPGRSGCQAHAYGTSRTAYVIGRLPGLDRPALAQTKEGGLPTLAPCQGRSACGWIGEHDHLPGVRIGGVWGGNEGRVLRVTRPARCGERSVRGDLPDGFARASHVRDDRVQHRLRTGRGGAQLLRRGRLGTLELRVTVGAPE